MEILTREAICTAIKKDGDRCSVPVVKETAFCGLHSGNIIENRALGGRMRSNIERARKHMPADLRVIAEGLEEAFAKASEGQLNKDDAESMTKLANAYINVRQQALEERIAAMEDMLAQLVDQSGIGANNEF